jgi:hypothetical protein
MRRLKFVIIGVLLTGACARMAPPPGGPLRNSPAVLVSTYPDTLVVAPDFRGDAEFRFDEVILESTPNFGTGLGDLERLVMLSPDTTVPLVRWRRDRITVRPRGGWRPNTVYRIELAPGVTDLHRNVSKTSAVITFSTGGPPPERMLSGRVIDWIGRRAVPTALIEAFHLPDSIRYRMIADSTGRFRFEHLPSGEYLVSGVNDQSRDHRRQVDEAWDTVRVAASSDSAGEIWVFSRDTLPPKIQGDLTRVDSVTIAVTFTRPIDPALHLDSASIRVLLLPDSGTVGPRVAYPKAAFDSLFRPAPVPRTAKDDSLARLDSLRTDSLARANPPPGRTARGGRGAVPPPSEDPPQQRRPTLGNVIVIRTQGQLRPGSDYYVELRGVRTAGGATGPPVFRVLKVPKARSAADSLKSVADSLRADSLRRTRPGPRKPA